MEARDGVGYTDNSYMYYGQEVDSGTNFPGPTTSGIKEETARLSESASEDEHYFSHPPTTAEHNHASTSNNNDNEQFSSRPPEFSPPRPPNDDFSSPRVSNDEFTSPRVSSDEYKRPPSDTAMTYDGVPPVKKGRGRPKKVYDGVEIKEWSDEEIYKLIELWGKYDILYNCKHPMYHNKVEKSNAVEALRERLEEARITASTRQICDKLTTLRNYYGAVKRKSDSLKRQGFEGDEAYYCRWQFYQPLSFLEGTFSPRTGTEYPRKQLPYVMDNTMSMLPSDRSLPSIQSITSLQVRPPSNLIRENFDGPKESSHQQQHQHHHQQQKQQQQQRPPQMTFNHSRQSLNMHQPAHTNQIPQSSPGSHMPRHPPPSSISLPLQVNHPPHSCLPLHPPQPMLRPHSLTPSGPQSSNNPYKNQSSQTNHFYPDNRNSEDKTEDQLFGEMVAKMISGIADSEEKAHLLIRIQQDIVKTKFQSKAHKTATENNDNNNIPHNNVNNINISNNNNTSNNNNNGNAATPAQTKESSSAQQHQQSGYFPDPKVYRSVDHSPLSSRSDSPLSSPACTLKLNNPTGN